MSQEPSRSPNSGPAAPASAAPAGGGVAGGASEGARTPPASAGMLCPYCGTLQPAGEAAATNSCKACRNRLDPLARIATHNAMGAWFIRDLSNPFAPGCSYATIRAMCERGRVRLTSVVRGPTTQQFWRLAAHTPGVAVLLGQCHACAEKVTPGMARCPACDATLTPQISMGGGRFVPIDDRQALGLPAQQVLPGEGDAAAALDSLAAVIGHAGMDRPGSVLGAAPAGGTGGRSADGQGGARGGAGGGRDRAKALIASLISVGVLLVALMLWSVVLPAMGVPTGVEEITGLRRVDEARAARGAADGAMAVGGSVAQGSASGSGAAGSAEDEGVDGASASDESLAALPGGDGRQGETGGETGGAEGGRDADSDAEDRRGGLGAVLVDDRIDRDAFDRLMEAHRRALTGELGDLVALRDTIDAIAAEVVGGQDGVDWADTLPRLAALRARVEERIAARRALDLMDIP
ncbi:MAG: hypothetical protein ACTS3F_13260 [Phycisphaerales bacterium]